MKLSDMTAAEKKVFGSLVRVMVGADSSYSDDEMAGLESIAAELGEDEFWEMVSAAGGHALDEDEVKSEAGAVDRAEVRETIYGVLFNIAATETIAVQESRLLEWLADVWDLDRSAATS